MGWTSSFFVGLAVTMVISSGCVEDPSVAPIDPGGIYWDTEPASARRGDEGDPGPVATAAAEPSQDHTTAWIVGLRGDHAGTGLPANPFCRGTLRPVHEAAGEGVTFDTFQIEPATRGMPFRSHVRTNVSATVTGLTFYDDAGQILRESERSASAPHKGTVPEAASTAMFWSCAGGPSQMQYRAGSWDHVATDEFTGEFSRAEWNGCPGKVTAAVGARFPRFEWQPVPILPDGAAASIAVVEFHFESPVKGHGILDVKDSQGNTLAYGKDDVVIHEVPPDNVFHVRVSGCYATTGSWSVDAVAELHAS